MAKNIVSAKSIPFQKPKLMKLKKKKNIIGKVMGYLKSDDYLFAPLISQSHFKLIPHPASTGVERGVPVIRKKLTLLDYLMSDGYMYAPLIDQEPCLDADKYKKYLPDEKEKTNSNRVEEEAMKKLTDKTRVSKHQKDGDGVETMGLDNGNAFGKTTGVKHRLLHGKETVEHAIQRKRDHRLGKSLK